MQMRQLPMAMPHVEFEVHKSYWLRLRWQEKGALGDTGSAPE